MRWLAQWIAVGVLLMSAKLLTLFPSDKVMRYKLEEGTGRRWAQWRSGALAQPDCGEPVLSSDRCIFPVLGFLRAGTWSCLGRSAPSSRRLCLTPVPPCSAAALGLTEGTSAGGQADRAARLSWTVTIKTRTAWQYAGKRAFTWH